MIRVAALLCACSMVLVACYGGSRAIIVRASAPVVPVCLDGSGPQTPAYRRACPVSPAAQRAAVRRAVAKRMGAARLRVSVAAPPRELRRSEPADAVSREAYIDDLLRRRSVGVASPGPAASPLLRTVSGPAMPTARPDADLRGSLD